MEYNSDRLLVSLFLVEIVSWVGTSDVLLLTRSRQRLPIVARTRLSHGVTYSTGGKVLIMLLDGHNTKYLDFDLKNQNFHFLPFNSKR